MNTISKSIIISLIIVLVTPINILAVTDDNAPPKTDLSQSLKNEQEKFKEARKEFLQRVNDYKSARNEFLKVKEEHRILKDKKLKELARKKLEERAKIFISHAINALIKHLEALKNKAKNSAKILEEDRLVIVGEIDKEITLLQEKLSKVESMTKDELINLAKEIRSQTKKVRYVAKKVTGLLMVSRLNFVVNKLQNSVEKISNKIADLKNAGKDVSELEKQVSEFNELLTFAKEKISSAKAKFVAISGIENVNILFKEGMDFVREANKSIKDAHKILVKIINGIKKIIHEAQQELEKSKGLKAEEKSEKAGETEATSTSQ